MASQRKDGGIKLFRGNGDAGIAASALLQARPTGRSKRNSSTRIALKTLNLLIKVQSWKNAKPGQTKTLVIWLIGAPCLGESWDPQASSWDYWGLFGGLLGWEGSSKPGAPINPMPYA